MYTVYIIQSDADQTFYTGMTENLERRLAEHNAGASKYTSGHGTWTLVYIEQCPTGREARERERYWKSGAGRAQRDEMFGA